MLSIQNQLSRATQAQIASQLETNSMLADKAMDSMQQIIELNLSLAKATLGQTNFATRQILSVNDVRQFALLVNAQMQPNARRALDYGYYLTTIAAGTQADIIKIVGGVIADTNRKLIELAEDFCRSAPLGVGAKTAIAYLKTLIDSAAISCDELARGKQGRMLTLSNRLEETAGE
jgi:phasin family protein